MKRSLSQIRESFLLEPPWKRRKCANSTTTLIQQLDEYTRIHIISYLNGVSLSQEVVKLLGVLPTVGIYVPHLKISISSPICYFNESIMDLLLYTHLQVNSRYRNIDSILSETFCLFNMFLSFLAMCDCYKECGIIEPIVLNDLKYYKIQEKSIHFHPFETNGFSKDQFIKFYKTKSHYDHTIVFQSEWTIDIENLKDLVLYDYQNNEANKFTHIFEWRVSMGKYLFTNNTCLDLLLNPRYKWVVKIRLDSFYQLMKHHIPLLEEKAKQSSEKDIKFPTFDIHELVVTGDLELDHLSMIPVYVEKNKKRIHKISFNTFHTIDLKRMIPYCQFVDFIVLNTNVEYIEWKSIVEQGLIEKSKLILLFDRPKQFSESVLKNINTIKISLSDLSHYYPLFLTHQLNIQLFFLNENETWDVEYDQLYEIYCKEVDKYIQFIEWKKYWILQIDPFLPFSYFYLKYYDKTKK